jgi:hypothetical protein
MRIATLLGLLVLITASAAQYHTTPDRWKESRLYHRAFEEQFASRIRIDRCAVPAALPKQQPSPNHAYWCSLAPPDRTKSGPWNCDVFVYSERDYLLWVRLKDMRECHDVSWVNEKLLHIRVWWGRICATDLILDVESERIIYREMVWDGTIDYQQFQEAKKRPDKPRNPPQ